MQPMYNESPFSLRHYLDGYEGSFRCKMAHQPEFADPCSADMTEAEIAACVDVWLSVHHWETFPEVALKNRAKRPDLIARKSQWVHVIECKKAFGLPVMEQAFSWLSSHHNPKAGLPHLISIAVKRNATSRRSDFGVELVKKNGIGLIEVEKRAGRKLGSGDDLEFTPPTYALMVIVEPRIIPGSRRLGRVLSEQLNADTRIATAGTPGNTGMYMTDWKRTMLRVEQYLHNGEPRSSSELVTYLNSTGGHHWCNKSSAISGINASLTRLGYVRCGHAPGQTHLWGWKEGQTKKIIKG